MCSGSFSSWEYQLPDTAPNLRATLEALGYVGYVKQDWNYTLGYK